MVNQELLGYIRQQQAADVSKEDITKQLLSVGWDAQDVAAGFMALSTRPPTTRPVTISQAPLTNAAAGVSVFDTSVRKSHTATFALVGILIILVISGVAFAYIEKLGPFAGAPTPAPSDTTAAMPEPVATTTANNLIATTSAPVATTTANATQDCGSVDTSTTSSLNGVNSMSPQTKSSLVCGSKALESCNPAVLVYTSTGTTTTSTLKIVGRESSYCLMSMATNVSTTVRTCKVPISLISQIVQSAQKSQPGDLFSYSISAAGLFFAGIPLTNTQTGQKITIDCSSS